MDLNAFAFVFRLFGKLLFLTVVKIFNLKNPHEITIVIFHSLVTVNFSNLFKVIDFLAPKFKNITIELLSASPSVFGAVLYGMHKQRRVEATDNNIYSVTANATTDTQNSVRDVIRSVRVAYPNRRDENRSSSSRGRLFYDRLACRSFANSCRTTFTSQPTHPPTLPAHNPFFVVAVKMLKLQSIAIAYRVTCSQTHINTVTTKIAIT